MKICFRIECDIIFILVNMKGVLIICCLLHGGSDCRFNGRSYFRCILCVDCSVAALCRCVCEFGSVCRIRHRSVISNWHFSRAGLCTHEWFRTVQLSLPAVGQAPFFTFDWLIRRRILNSWIIIRATVISPCPIVAYKRTQSLAPPVDTAGWAHAAGARLSVFGKVGACCFTGEETRVLTATSSSDAIGQVLLAVYMGGAVFKHISIEHLLAKPFDKCFFTFTLTGYRSSGGRSC